MKSIYLFFLLAMLSFSFAKANPCFQLNEDLSGPNEKVELRFKVHPDVDPSEVEASARGFLFALSGAHPIADRLIFWANGVRYSVRRANNPALADEKVVLAINSFEKLREEVPGGPKFKLIVSSKIWSGGISGEFYIKEKELKGLLSQIPHAVVNKPTAVGLKSSAGKDFLVVYTDTMDSKKKEITREVQDLLYPRPYEILKLTREKIHSNVGISLTDLDAIFGAWDGTSYPNPDSVIGNDLKSQLGSHGKGKTVSWFLAEKAGRYFRVIFLNGGVGEHPQIVTVLRLTREEEAHYSEFINQLKEKE